MRYTGLIRRQRIQPTPKRIRVHGARYAADEGGCRTNIETWLGERQAALLREGGDRYSDYDDLAFYHLLMGDIRQIAFGDTAGCREHLYQGAVYKSYACRYFERQPAEDRARMGFEVNLRALDYFEAAVVADAEEIARTLGEQLLAADQSGISEDVVHMEGALIYLYLGEDDRAGAACAAISRHERERWKSAYSKVAVFEALLEGDNQRFYDLFVDSLRRNRRDPNLVHFLDLLHIAMGKIAIRRGFDLPIDTADCPRCLLRPEWRDWSQVALLKPREGLFWEKER